MSTIYFNKDGILEKFLQVLIKYLSNKPEIVFTESLSKEAQQNLIKLSPTRTLPLLKEGDHLITGTLPIIKFLFLKDDTNKEIFSTLFGSTQLEQTKNEMFLNFIENSICPITNEIFMNLKGKKKYNEYLVTVALNDLIEKLQCLNEQLKFKTFLVSHHVSVSDIFLTAALFHTYTDALTEQFRKNIPNVIRLFLFMKDVPEIFDVYGKAEECKKMAEPLPFVDDDKKDKKDDKKEDKKKEDKKKDKKDKGKKKEEKKEEK